MSAPRIKVVVEDLGLPGWPWFTWSCTGCAPMEDNGPGGTWSSFAAAADAGRRHLFVQHGRQRIEAVVGWADSQLAYSRQCGVPIAACGADTCHCVPVDPGAELGRENAAQQFEDDFPCCAPDVRDQYAQTANQSREDC